jgi:MYXO-CTERM domain-containing protein
MKSLNLKGITRIGALSLVLALTGAVPAFAQNNANSVRTEERRTETTRVVNQDDDTDWGWLGLLGLLGLTGLLPKKRSIEVKGVRDVNETRPAA